MIRLMTRVEVTGVIATRSFSMMRYDDFDSESRKQCGDESDIVVPLMDVGASPSRHARIFPGSPGHMLQDINAKTWLGVE